MLPAWRDTAGQGRDSLGRGTSPEDLARVADKDPEVLRAVDGQKRAVAASYRDPEAAADALDALIEKSGNDLRVVAQALRQDGPEVLGELRGREGWLASPAAKTARDATVRNHTTAVDQQRTRDAVEVPGLSGGLR